jgi:putative hemolysin
MWEQVEKHDRSYVVSGRNKAATPNHSRGTPNIPRVSGASPSKHGDDSWIQKEGETMKALFAIAAVVAISGCSSASGVIATGPETYMVTGQADLGPNKTAAARQAAIEAATTYCAKLGKRPVVESATNEDVGSAGVFQLRGGTTLTFRCIELAK